MTMNRRGNTAVLYERMTNGEGQKKHSTRNKAFNVELYYVQLTGSADHDDNYEE